MVQLEERWVKRCAVLLKQNGTNDREPACQDDAGELTEAAVHLLLESVKIILEFLVQRLIVVLRLRLQVCEPTFHGSAKLALVFFDQRQRVVDLLENVALGSGLFLPAFALQINIG